MALMSLCIGVHISVCTHVHMHICPYAHMCTHVRRILKNIRLSVHACVQKHCLFVCVYIFVEVLMFIHVIFG